MVKLKLNPHALSSVTCSVAEKLKGSKQRKGILPNGIMEVEAERSRIGLRPYSSASWPIRVNPIVLKMPPTCNSYNVINHALNYIELKLDDFHKKKLIKTSTNEIVYPVTVFYWITMYLAQRNTISFMKQTDLPYQFLLMSKQKYPSMITT